MIDSMNTKQLQVTALIVLAVLSLGLAVYYSVTPANALLSFIPGHDATNSQPHIKHALAALVLAAGLGALSWFMTGKKSTTEA
jgi:amino acid permease